MTEIRGSLYSPPEHRPSPDDVDEAMASVEYAAEKLEMAISALNGAHLLCEANGVPSPIGNLFDIPGLTAAHAALVERHGMMQRRGR
jgi:hypothetical protein